jgi:hypothetical protein
MVEFNINNLLSSGGVSPTTGNNFDSLLNLARGQLENISQQVQGLINQTQVAGRSAVLDTAGIRIQVPQLANLITGQQDVLLKTAFPIDQNQPLNINVQSTNVVLDQGKPVLQLQGQILQNNVAPQRFTAQLPLQSLANSPNLQVPQTGGVTSQNTDQVIRNFLPQNNVTAFTNNLSDTIRSVLPQNLQNINFAQQNNFNIQINSFTVPSGEQIVLNQNLTGTNLQNVIQGRVEIFPSANEALVRTDFGTFRIANLTQLPNGSQLNFTIQGQATPAPQAQVTNNILGLNPTNLQTLRLSLEGAESPLQSLLKILNSSQALAPHIQRYFPHPDDKAAYARSLMFLSNVNKGSPEGWLGEDGQFMVNNIPEADTNFGRLQEVFGVLQNFSGKGQQPVSTEWNSYLIPLYDGNKLSFVTIQVQKDPDGENKQTTKGKRKFILELEQDKLGRVAIEGLYSKIQGKVNNLDVVLKTEKTVDDEFMKELSRIYNDTAIAYGFNGSLTFAPFTTATPLYTDISKILGDGIVI